VADSSDIMRRMVKDYANNLYFPLMDED